MIYGAFYTAPRHEKYWNSAGLTKSLPTAKRLATRGANSHWVGTIRLVVSEDGNVWEADATGDWRPGSPIPEWEAKRWIRFAKTSK